METKLKLPNEFRGWNLVNSLTEDMRRRQVEAQNKLMDEAFQEHFGYSIEEADAVYFERTVDMGDRTEALKYKGQTFLIMKAPKYHIVVSAAGDTIYTAEQIYLKV